MDSGRPAQEKFLKPTTLAIEIARHLREAIIRGDIQPGQRLNESKLTQNLELSRSPVREALRILEAEGLVILRPRRGAYVRPLSAQDLLEVFDVRMMFETYAIRQGRHRLTPDSLQVMSDALAEARSALDRSAFEPWHQASVRFHDGLVAIGGNSHLTRLYNRLKAHLRRFQIFLISVPLQPLKSQADHEAILKALEQGDTDLTLELLTNHITSLKQTLLTCIREKTGEDPSASPWPTLTPATSTEVTARSSVKAMRLPLA